MFEKIKNIFYPPEAQPIARLVSGSDVTSVPCGPGVNAASDEIAAAKRELNGPKKPAPAPQPRLTRREQEALEFQKQRKLQEEKQLAKIDEALFGQRDMKRNPARAYERLEKVPYTLEFFRWLQKRLKPTEAELSEVRAHNAKYEAAAFRLAEYGTDRITKFIDDTRNEQLQALLRGETPKRAVPDYYEVFDMFESNRSAIYAEMKIHGEAASIVIREIVKRIKEGSVVIADELESEGREVHEKGEGRFGWPWRPSLTIIALRQLEWRIDAMIPRPAAGLSPRKILASIGVDL